MVNEHRITLGRWEREQVKDVKDALNVALIGTGIGIGAVGIGGTFVAYKVGKSIYDWVEDGIGDEILKFVGVPDSVADKIDENNTLSGSGPTVVPVQRLFWQILGL